VAPALQIRLLGGFEVTRGGTPVPASAWNRRRPADLLKLLALTPGHTLPRERVFEALWPDKDPSSAANNLHRALYDLRHVIGEVWVDLAHGQVTLKHGAWVDTEALEEAVRQGGPEALRTAVRLYRGELAPEDPESPWLEPHRRRLRQRFLEAIHPVAREAALAGQIPLAISLLRQLLHADPASEEGHQLLMRLLAEDGQWAAALRQFEACAAGKRAAGLGAPSPASEALRDSIARNEIGPPRGADGRDGAHRAARRLLGHEALAVLRGREQVMAFLDALLARGSGMVVLLGEAGAGATRVALEGAREAQARGATVLCGSAGQAQGAPGALFADLLGAAGPAQGDLLDDVLEALHRAGAGGPLYLLLDDLHRADPASLELILPLMRQAAGLRLVLVATCREDAIHAGTSVQHLLARLDAEGLARGLHVPRLSMSGTAALVGDLIGATPSESLAAAVYQATDGLPAQVEAALAGWRETGLLPLRR
jgi:DNA-binding SARP family transcriptional activator